MRVSVCLGAILIPEYILVPEYPTRTRPKTHFGLFLPQYQPQRKCFSSVRIAWHIEASSAVYTLIDNDKNVNKIARLVAIVEKRMCVVDHQLT